MKSLLSRHKNVPRHLGCTRTSSGFYTRSTERPEAIDSEAITLPGERSKKNRETYFAGDHFEIHSKTFRMLAFW